MIREATFADMSRLIVMASEFVRTTQYGRLFNPDLLPGLVLELLENHVVFVAELAEDKRVAGMLALAIVPHILTGRRYAEEIAWWVDPGYRNGSIGPRLMHHMECYVRQNRLHMVKMLAPAGSSVGDFYKKCGYQELESAWIKVFD